MSSRRLGPICGVVFFVLIVASLIWNGDSPMGDDSSAKIVSYWRDHHDRQLWSIAPAMVSLVFLAGFVAALRDRIRAAETKGSLWSNAVLIGGAAAIAAILAAAWATVATAVAADNDRGAEVLLALNALNADSAFVFIPPFGIIALAVAGATLSLGALPRWLGWAALVLGVVMFVPPPAGFIAFALMGLWIVAVSAVMQRPEPLPSTVT